MNVKNKFELALFFLWVYGILFIFYGEMVKMFIVLVLFNIVLEVTFSKIKYTSSFYTKYHILCIYLRLH